MTCFRADSWRSNLNNFPPSTFTRYLKKDYLYDCSILFRNKAPERRSVKRSAWLAKTKHCWNLNSNLFSCENHESPSFRQKKTKSNRQNLKTKILNVFSSQILGKIQADCEKDDFSLKRLIDSVADWIFFGKSHSYKTKCQIGIFHEVLPGNSVFFNFYYNGTKGIRYLDHTNEFSIKNYITMWILSSGGGWSWKMSRNPCVLPTT